MKISRIFTNKNKHNSTIKTFLKNNRNSLILFFIAIAVYANTLANGYVLDDADLIVNNTEVHKGIGIVPGLFTSKMRSENVTLKNEIYRPISKFVYALEWQIAPNKPWFAHALNWIVFALLCATLYKVLVLLFQNNSKPAFITSLLFTLHPIHTEVVASIKSSDEILSLLFALLAVLQLKKHHVSKDIKKLIGSIILIFLSILSKESGVAFVILVPLFLYYSNIITLKSVVKYSLILVIPLTIFIAMRWQVVGDIDQSAMVGKIDNYLVAISPESKQFATALFLQGMYLKLVLFPYPLACDYSFPQLPVAGFSNPLVIIVVFAMLLSVWLVLKGYKKRNLISFGLAWYWIAILPVSNIFFLIGTNLGERLLFVPSLGILIGFGVLFEKLGAVTFKSATINNTFKPKFLANFLLAVLCLMMFGYTYARNADWRSNLSLFERDAQTNYNSARLQFNLANALKNEIIQQNGAPAVQEKNLPQIKRSLDRSLLLYPEYGTARFALGEYYSHIGNYPEAIVEFKKARFYLPFTAKTHVALAATFGYNNQIDSAIIYLREGISLTKSHPNCLLQMAKLFQKQEKSDSAIKYLQQFLVKEPNSQEGLDMLKTLQK